MKEEELIQLAEQGQVEPESLTDSEIQELALAVLPELSCPRVGDLNPN